MYLVLSRAAGEEVRLVLPDGREARVLVAEFDSRGRAARVRLAVDAPDDVVIQRPEADVWTLDGPELADALARHRRLQLTLCDPDFRQ
jgi:sRNA-binding carbon storage regulator CsrA